MKATFSRKASLRYCFRSLVYWNLICSVITMLVCVCYRDTNWLVSYWEHKAYFYRFLKGHVLSERGTISKTVGMLRIKPLYWFHYSQPRYYKSKINQEVHIESNKNVWESLCFVEYKMYNLFVTHVYLCIIVHLTSFTRI